MSSNRPAIIIPAEHQKIIDEVMADVRKNDGLATVDIEKFWADQEIAIKDPFGDIPQVPLGLAGMSGECIYDELGIPEDYWKYEQDEEWRLQMHCVYNDKSEKIVGRRLLNEKAHDKTKDYPATKQLYHVFESENVWHVGSWWLQQSAHGEDELTALLDRVEARLENLRSFILPEGWDEAKARLMQQGIKPGLVRGIRGPVTFATSIFGAEYLIYLIYDNPDLASRFSSLILKGLLKMAEIMDEEAGYTPETAPRGFGFADDNCALLTADMYELFGYPVLKGMFDKYSPAPEDWRYQHSDSAMAQLLPVIGRLDMKGVNFGPTVTVDEIRHYMPNAAIHGQLAPFTFSMNEEERMIAEFLRDYDLAKEKKGLVFTTAGSINNGSLLTGMRILMSVIQKYGRF
ncbi:MAG: uroporphyrinogen decarboxylase family protein [bacterium]